MALILVAFSLFPAVTGACAHLLGICSTPNFPSLFTVFLPIVKAFGMTFQVSQMENEQEELIQCTALGQKDRKELELRIQRLLGKEETAGADGKKGMGTEKMGGEKTGGE